MLGGGGPNRLILWPAQTLPEHRYGVAPTPRDSPVVDGPHHPGAAEPASSPCQTIRDEERTGFT